MNMETSTPSDAEGLPFDDVTFEDSSLNSRVFALETTIRDLVAATNTQNELLQQIRDAVEPAIEGIKNSAVGSMLGIR